MKGENLEPDDAFAKSKIVKNSIWETHSQSLLLQHYYNAIFKSIYFILNEHALMGLNCAGYKNDSIRHLKYFHK